MTGENYTRVPTGKLVNRGEPVIQTEKILTATAKAGMLAVIDGNDYKCKPSDGTGIPVGFIGYEQTDYKYRPMDYETAYVAGNVVMVLAGGNFEIYAPVAASQTVTIGTKLADNGNGMLKVAGSTDKVVAMALESKTTTAAGERVAVESLI